jgi:hypothetical protein
VTIPATFLEGAWSAAISRINVNGEYVRLSNAVKTQTILDSGQIEWCLDTSSKNDLDRTMVDFCFAGNCTFDFERVVEGCVPEDDIDLDAFPTITVHFATAVSVAQSRSLIFAEFFPIDCFLFFCDHYVYICAPFQDGEELAPINPQHYLTSLLCPPGSVRYGVADCGSKSRFGQVFMTPFTWSMNYGTQTISYAPNYGSCDDYEINCANRTVPTPTPTYDALPSAEPGVPGSANIKWYVWLGLGVTTAAIGVVGAMALFRRSQARYLSKLRERASSFTFSSPRSSPAWTFFSTRRWLKKNTSALGATLLPEDQLRAHSTVKK